MLPLNTFQSRDAAIAAVAVRIELALHRALEKRDEVSFVASGGSTPGPVYSRLAHKTVDWHRVHVIPSDERWVPVDHPDSNANMLRSTLTVSRATYARVLSMYEGDTSPEAYCGALNGIKNCKLNSLVPGVVCGLCRSPKFWANFNQYSDVPL